MDFTRNIRLRMPDMARSTILFTARTGHGEVHEISHVQKGNKGKRISR